MRQFSGFATPEETNARYRYLLANGGGGLSVAFDLPTLMGYDSDAAESEGEVGKCGVAIDSLEDMEALFSGIELEKTSVSMTINSPANVIWAMYLVVVEKQGGDWKKIAGTLQNDILKEYIAQKEYIFPPAPSMRLVIDTIEFGSLFTPRFNPFRSADITFARPVRQRCRSWPSRSTTASSTWSGRCAAASSSMISLPG
jgi:methylmalonyl-CoA mutase N-terminal domain/subunit